MAAYRLRDALGITGPTPPGRRRLSRDEIRARLDRFRARLAHPPRTAGVHQAAQTFGEGWGTGDPSTLVSSPLYYDPRWASPDKFYFPRTEEQANSIWRHLYVTDPATAVALDLYSQTPWSNFDIIGIDDPHIRKVYEDMLSAINLEMRLPTFTLEFLKLGKCVIHLVFDSGKGYWTQVFHHNPDIVRVTPVPFLGHEPLLDLRPTPDMQRFVNSPDPRAQQISMRLPPEVRDMIRTGRPIPLDSANVTYLARKSADYESLGTSLLTRLFRVQMLEDVLSNATIAVAQRNAAPLRIFKIGDPQTGWIPNEDDGHAEHLMEMLAIAETDPLAAIVYTNALQVDYVGVSDKFMSVTREFDYIERVKMLALGISKSFLLGEASYASAIAGLQAFIERLRSLREKIEAGWMYPKFFMPIAIVNMFYKRTKAELDHRVRTDDFSESNLVIPTIRWRKALDPVQDQTLLSTWQILHEKGILSDRTYAIGAGVNLDIERKNILEELKYKQMLAKKHPELVQAQQGEAGGLPGLGPMPGPMPGLEGVPLPPEEGEGIPPPPEGGGEREMAPPPPEAAARASDQRAAEDDLAHAVRQVLAGDDTDHPDLQGYAEWAEKEGNDPQSSDTMNEWLVTQGYTDQEIRKILARAVPRPAPRKRSAKLARLLERAERDLRRGGGPQGADLLSGVHSKVVPDF